MRETNTTSGVTLKGFSGSSSVLLAVDIDDVKAKRKGLLGFAFHRTQLDGKWKGSECWLRGLLRFPHQAGVDPTTLDSRTAPIQKFRWSDYTVDPGVEYRYQAFPVYLPATSPRLGEGTDIVIRTMSTSGDQKHTVLFNRAAAASQAFARDFPEEKKRLDEHVALAKTTKKSKGKKKKSDPIEDEKEAEELLSPQALAWLSRGALEQITGYIAEASGKGFFLDIAIYEYELSAIRTAVFDAAKRGVAVRLIYHAKKGDAQTKVNEDLIATPNDLAAVAELVKPRLTSSIMHDKYVVRGRLDGGKRVAEAVLCGSTNFTLNGVYRQANVVHIARDPAIAEQYENMFEVLLETRKDPGATRKKVTEVNPITLAADKPVFAGFSPRSGRADLDTFIAVIKGAGRDVLFCTAFALPRAILDALLGKPNDPILRFGLQNSRSTITGTHADRTAQFDATAFLKDGLEGWQEESTYGQKGNILIHTKLIVVDFTSDSPTVISGSHNLSANASNGNDENFLVIHGNRDIADAYGCELMRFYDHYRFRWLHESAAKKKPKKGKIDEPPALRDSDAWADDYFIQGTLKFADRKRFVGERPTGGDPASSWPPTVVAGLSKKKKAASKKKAAKKKVAKKKVAKKKKI